MHVKLMLAASLTCLAACGGADPSGGDGSDASLDAPCPPGITVVDAWTRPARAGQPVSAAYLTLCNGDSVADALVAISADGDAPASAIELHISEMTDGVMAMKKVDRIALPANAETALKPGGAHVMLIGVSAAIDSDAAPRLRLQFENAAPITRTFAVRDAEPERHDGHDGHH